MVCGIDPEEGPPPQGKASSGWSRGWGEPGMPFPGDGRWQQQEPFLPLGTFLLTWGVTAPDQGAQRSGSEEWASPPLCF